MQRVARAAVRVEGETVGEIGRGLLVLVGLEKADSGEVVDRRRTRSPGSGSSRTRRGR